MCADFSSFVSLVSVAFLSSSLLMCFPMYRQVVTSPALHFFSSQRVYVSVFFLYLELSFGSSVTSVGADES